MKRSISAGAAALVMLGGCGGVEQAAEEPPAPSADSTASTPQAEATPVATTQQYASVIARQSDAVQHIKEMGDCNWIGAGSLDYEPGLFVCSVGLLSMEYEASTLATRLELAADPDADDFVGSPPEEVERLVEETIVTARALEKAARAAGTRDCAETGRGACGKLRVAVWSARSDLESSLDAWGPYL